jgi:hypothetical protein
VPARIGSRQLWIVRLAIGWLIAEKAALLFGNASDIDTSCGRQLNSLHRKVQFI